MKRLPERGKISNAATICFSASGSSACVAAANVSNHVNHSSKLKKKKKFGRFCQFLELTYFFYRGIKKNWLWRKDELENKMLKGVTPPPVPSQPKPKLESFRRAEKSTSGHGIGKKITTGLRFRGYEKKKKFKKPASRGLGGLTWSLWVQWLYPFSGIFLEETPVTV